MKITLGVRAALGMMFIACSVVGQGLEFTVDQVSPEPWNPADILSADGTAVVIPASELGRSPNEEVDAISYGTDEIEPVGFYNYVRFGYSVARGATGAGGAVSIQASVLGNGAAGDKFDVWYVGVQGLFFPIFGPRVVSDAPVHNLTPRNTNGPVESELNSLSLRFPNVPLYPIYFSVAPGVAGLDPAAIYIREDTNTPVRLFAAAGQLGLQPGDDIDALALVSLLRDPPLTLDSNVVVWISLTRNSPTVLPSVAGTDGAVQVFPGPPVLAVPGPLLDLSPGDELDAITGLDPGAFDPPILIPLIRDEEGFRFVLAGRKDTAYVIDRTTSIISGWTPWLSRSTLERPDLQLLDPESPTRGAFYRARVVDAD